MNRTRRAMLALGCTAFGRSASFAAQQKPVRIGYLANTLDPAKPTPTYRAFAERLRELGWAEGKNIEMRIKSSGDTPTRFPILAQELVQEKVDVIMCGSLAATRAAKATTTSIPIVFGSADDPVEQGLVSSLARPGGNVTGVATMVQQLERKRLELLKELLPHARSFARLYQPPTNIPAAQQALIAQLDTTARTLGVKLDHVAISEPADIEVLFAAAQNRADAFSVKTDAMLVRESKRIAALGLKHQLPIIGGDSRFAEAGTLLSYGENFPALYRRAAEMVDRILRHNVKPSDLPVEQATSAELELVVNLATAKQLGIEIPSSILILASRRID